MELEVEAGKFRAIERLQERQQILTMSDISNTLPNSQGFNRNAGLATLFAIVLAVLCLAAISLEGFKSLLVAWSRPEYSHGYIIPFIAAFLFLLRARDLPTPTANANGSLLGIALAIIGTITAVLGNLASIPDIITYGLITIIAGLILCVTGTKRGLFLWPALVYLIFMLPLPNFIYWPLSIKLQFLSSDIGVRVIQLLNIPVYLDGNIIDLGVYKLQVAEACNGLRYLFPLMSFGFLFAMIYNGNWWQKTILMLSTIPITIGMNSARIGIIGVLVNSYGIGQAEGFLHFFEGWVIFVVCIMLLGAEAKLLKMIGPKANRAPPLFDLDFESAYSELRKWKSIRVGTYFLGATLTVLLGIGLLAYLGNRPVENIARKNLSEFPMALGEWHGTTSLLDSEIEKVLGADDYLLADFTSAKGKPAVNLLVSYYLSQTKGAAMHSPEVCIPSSGWEVSRWGQFDVDLKEIGNTILPVNRAIIQKSQNRQLVYYWFEQRGRHLTSDYLAKAYTVIDSANRGRSDGALVRLVTPIDGAGVDAADKRLHDFLTLAFGELPKFVPP